MAGGGVKTETREHRIFGPPGTGKTTMLGYRVRRTVEKFGPHSVMVVSFSRTAAREIVGRGLPIERDRIGTLHSFGYRALGCPEIAETDKWITAWNERCARTHRIEVVDDAMRSTLDDPYADRVTASGPSLLSRLSLHRSRRDPPENVPVDVRQFGAAWSEFKRDERLIDFTDMIDLPFREEIPIPVMARVLYADEVQDFSPLELALVRMWGAQVDHFVLCGDDDQCIFSFRGASPRAFLHPDLPDAQKTILPKSYRLPKNIKDYADQWISAIEVRQPKTWEPRDSSDGGDVIKAQHLTLDEVGDFVERIEEEMRVGFPEETSVMVLTTCSYMLDRIVRLLKDKFVPFHNPYRPTNGRWNPMRGGVDRLKEYLCADIETTDSPRSRDWRSVWAWLECVDAKKAKLRSGAKKKCKEMASLKEASGIPVSFSDFNSVLGIDPPPRNDTNWLESVLKPSARGLFRFAIGIHRAHGGKALSSTPRLIVGTVHSVKGGEADSVFLFPDISRAAYDEMTTTGDGPDNIRRVFYVGMTRARQRLYLCGPSATSSTWIGGERVSLFVDI